MQISLSSGNYDIIASEHFRQHGKRGGDVRQQAGRTQTLGRR